MNWDEVKPELQKKLDPSAVKPAAPGKYGEYVDAYHVICEANRIFGEDGWSYRVTRLERVSEQTVQIRNGNEQYRVGYLCTVVVTVDGVEREGAAVGSGVGNPNAIADHHESAVKEAETDALKRALRSFGNTFGLALYDKTKSNVGHDFDAAGARDRLRKHIANARSLPDIEDLWKREVPAMAALKEASEPMYLEVRKAFQKRKAELTPNDAAMQTPPTNGSLSEIVGDEIPY